MRKGGSVGNLNKEIWLVRILKSDTIRDSNHGNGPGILLLGQALISMVQTNSMDFSKNFMAL